MKKIALIALLAAITSTSSFSQNTPTTSDPVVAPNTSNSTPALRMGLSVSPILSWFSMDIDETFVQTDGVRFNIQYGLHIDKRLGSNPNYYLSTGVFVMNTGGKLVYGQVDSETGTKSVITSDFRFNYINVPVALMLRTNDIGYMTYFARVGFDSGFNIKASQDYTEQEYGSTETTTQEKEDASDYVNLYRAALHLELGIEYKLSGNTRLMISAEWNNGLNNVFNNDFEVATIQGPSTELKTVQGTSNAILLRAGVYF
jgi:hypothetical protein